MSVVQSDLVRRLSTVLLSVDSHSPNFNTGTRVYVCTVMSTRVSSPAVGRTSRQHTCRGNNEPPRPAKLKAEKFLSSFLFEILVSKRLERTSP